MRDRFPLVMLGGLLLLGFLGSYVLQGARRGSFADALSTYRSDGQGARGLYLLAQEGGLPVGRHQQDLESLDEAASLALLGVEFSHSKDATKVGPLYFATDGGVEEEDEEVAKRRGSNVLYAPDVTVDEREKLLTHVRGGHTLIYAPWRAHENPLLKDLGVQLTAAEAKLGIRTLAPSVASPWTLGVERVEARVAVFLDLPHNAVTLLEDPLLGEAVMALIPYGQGQVIVLGAPELASNAALARADNAQLWLSLVGHAAGRGRLLFDEFHHGFTGERSLGEFARRYGLHFAAAQLLLGVMLWSAALRRFGRPRMPLAQERVGGTDALFASSRLYREGGHRAFAVSQILKGVTAELAPLAGLSPRSASPEVAGALTAAGRPELGSALTELLSLQASVSTDEDVRRAARGAALLRQKIRTRKSHEHRPSQRTTP